MRITRLCGRTAASYEHDTDVLQTVFHDGRMAKAEGWSDIQSRMLHHFNTGMFR